MYPNDDERAQKKFAAYHKIERPNESRLQRMLKSSIANDDWVATEKIHGYNLGIYLIDENNARFATRTQIMSPHKDFHGYHLIANELKFQVHAALELLKLKLGIPRIGLLIIDGYLFGANYDHPDVPLSTRVYEIPSPSLKIPPKRYRVADVLMNDEEEFPQYSPEIHFFAFDLRYSVSGNSKDLINMSYDYTCSVFEKVPKLIYGKPLARGPLKSLLKFGLENFETQLPAQLGLANCPLDFNYAAGVIVRHVKHGVPGFDHPGTPTILKIRTPAYMAMMYGRYRPDRDVLVEVLQKHTAMEKNWKQQEAP